MCAALALVQRGDGVRLVDARGAKTADDASFVDDGWNDRVSSLIVSASGTSTPGNLIQAENYSTMSGVSTEANSDSDRGTNVSYIDTADWMAYNGIQFPSSGTYRVEYRVASPSGGQMSLDLNAGATVLGTLDIPAMGDWQNWTTISHTVTVTAGSYNVGIYAQAGGWNFNWFRITKI
ncbi:carbohydrate-binding protein [Archangium minus]|uniref:carbohydrate-binding protein n=1 Tax=Archangium minus TaxID=83450 RepID=UPI0037C13F61